MASGHDAAAGAIAYGVAIGSSPQWKSVGAAVLGGEADEPERLLGGRVRERRDGMELESLEAELERVLEQRHRLVAVPGVDAREGLEPIRVGAACVGDQFERVRVDLRRVHDRHHDAPVDAGLVQPPHALRRLEIPPERGDRVDMKVSVDDHGCGATASSSG